MNGRSTQTSTNRRTMATLVVALGMTLPWGALWLTSKLDIGAQVALDHLSPLLTVAVSGISVLGASFLLAWGAETAEKDVPRALAIAVLAVLAVAPEYAVDALYAWHAGQLAGTPEGIEAGNLAVANMTGANRILIGVGWAGIALFTVFRSGARSDPSVKREPGFLTDAVAIDRDVALDIIFLLLATLWAFAVPINGGINLLDTVVLVGLYVAYIGIVIKGDVDVAEEHVGVPAYFHTFTKRRRVFVVVFLFAYSGAVIFTAVEPFAHGLEQLGQSVGVPSFFMIQWIAPLASESPELIVVLYLVNKARSTAGFNALISSKLNQWTLLIGTLVVVYSLALGQYGALPFDQKQASEIWLTAAQSFFAIAILIDFQISTREALVVLVLCVSQVLVEFLLIRDILVLSFSSTDLLSAYSVIYVVLGLGLFITRREALRDTVRRAIGTASGAMANEDDHVVAGDD